MDYTKNIDTFYTSLLESGLIKLDSNGCGYIRFNDDKIITTIELDDYGCNLDIGTDRLVGIEIYCGPDKYRSTDND